MSNDIMADYAYMDQNSIVIITFFYFFILTIYYMRHNSRL